MLHFKFAILAAIGGALGSAARYLTGAAAVIAFGANFPWGTMIVNVVGSFLMGFLTGLAVYRSAIGPDLRVFLTTGILGGYTTFSAFALDTSFLAGRQLSLAAGYVLGSLVLSIAALYLGIALSKLGL